MCGIKSPPYLGRLQYTATYLTLIFSFVFAGVAPAEEFGESTAQAEYSEGAKQCMTCHREGRDLSAQEIFKGPMGISDAAHSAFSDDKHDCETCHGPSASHRRKNEDGSRPPPAITFDENTPAAKQNEVCHSCHSGAASLIRSTALIHWQGSVHNEEEIACAGCHTVHAERDPVFDALAQQEVCFSCHPSTRSETFRNSSHPLRFGAMTCTDCHNPHNGSNDFLLKRSTVNDTCYTCHAEKRGPFLWEHAPVSEDCSLCHNPHGSNHEALLKQRPPLLCQQCHAPGGHASTGYTTESAENSFQQRFILGQSCSNCHAQVHGSNHPSGVTITR